MRVTLVAPPLWTRREIVRLLFLRWLADHGLIGGPDR
jgi:hypothetical protein